MSVDECISAEELAQLFHRYHGVLTGCFDGCTATRPWGDVDAHQRRLLVATARLVLDDLASKQHAGEAAESLVESIDSIDYTARPTSNTESETDRAARRRYYAKPGQAEWGC